MIPIIVSRKLVALLSALVVVSSVSADGVWSSGAYRYDGAGNITAIGNHTYGHDAVGRFTGHERDFDTAAPTGISASLDAMHARYYTAVTGRFLSVDPVLDIREALTEPQLWNRYTYVTNNPLKFTDPDGRYRTFYKEKAMTSENLRMDENTPVIVKGAFYVQGGLVGLVAGEAIAVAGGQGLLAAAGRKMFEWGVRATPLLNVLRKWGAGETGAPSLPFGISNKGLNHALKHLDQFQALDRSFDQNRMIALAAKIVADGDNLVGTPGGRTVYEQVVKVGDELVKVRVIVNPEGNLRSVHIRP